MEMWHETAPFSISVPGGSSSFPTSLGTTQLMLQWFAAAKQQLLLSMCCFVLHKACRSFLGMFLSLSSCGSVPLAWYCCPGVHVGSLPGSSLCLFSPCPWWREPLISRVGGVIWLKIILLSLWFGCHARSKVVLQNARDSDAVCGSCGLSMAWGLELRKVNVCWGIPPIPSSKFPSVHAFLQINCSANTIESCNVLKLDLG